MAAALRGRCEFYALTGRPALPLGASIRIAPLRPVPGGVAAEGGRRRAQRRPRGAAAAASAWARVSTPVATRRSRTYDCRCRAPAARWLERVEQAGCLGEPGEQRGLGPAQPARREPAEVPLAGGEHPVVAVAEVDGAQVHAEDRRLGVVAVELEGERDLGDPVGDPGPAARVDHLGELLGDRAAALVHAGHPSPERPTSPTSSTPSLAVEAGVLGGHDGLDDAPGGLGLHRDGAVGAVDGGDQGGGARRPAGWPARPPARTAAAMSRTARPVRSARRGQRRRGVWTAGRRLSGAMARAHRDLRPAPGAPALRRSFGAHRRRPAPARGRPDGLRRRCLQHSVHRNGRRGRAATVCPPRPDPFRARSRPLPIVARRSFPPPGMAGALRG